MIRYCEKCGYPLDESTGLCPRCDRTKATEPNRNLEDENQNNKYKGPKYQPVAAPTREKGATEASSRVQKAGTQEPGKKKHKGLFAAVGIAILLVAVFLFLKRPEQSTPVPHELTVMNTEKQTVLPTEAPAEPPTQAPTEPPTQVSTEPPTQAPTEPPTQAPTEPTAEMRTESPVEPTASAYAILGGQSVEPNDFLYLGTDPDGTEILWQILEVRGDRALLVSDEALDSRPYHETRNPVTWETCTLRSWLNEDFLRMAFSEEEKSLILETQVSADRNPQYDTDPGRSTWDRVFLLSLPEVKRYFPDDHQRICVPSAYALRQGIFTNGGCWFLLRTPGSTPSMVASTNSNGSIDYDGGNVDSLKGGIRPAMWIRIS